MTRFFLFATLGLAVLALSGCSVTLEQILRGVEPLIDAGAQFAANSAGAMVDDALKEQLGDQWTGGEITTAVAGTIMGLYTMGKGAAFGVNRTLAKRQAQA